VAVVKAAMLDAHNGDPQAQAWLDYMERHSKLSTPELTDAGIVITIRE